MILKDTSYAVVRRLFFVENAIREYLEQRGISSAVIADIGCGTGELLTIPLAENLGKEAIIHAFEPESATFQSLKDQIRGLGIQNVHPIHDRESLQNLKFDAIILSEVIEHIENPAEFLFQFKHLLKNLGIMIITTPNGYGVFELETMLFNTLDLIGLIPLLRRIKRTIIPANNNVPQSISADTLAISPHINFFTLDDIYNILERAGLSLKKIEGKHFSAGPFSDRIINKSERLIKLNARLGEKLPLVLAAGWMLIAENTQDRIGKIKFSEMEKDPNFLRKIYTQYKRWLNVHLANRQNRK